MHNVLITWPGEPGTGPSRLLNLCYTLSLTDLSFETIKYVSHAAGQQASTSARHTCRWDPPRNSCTSPPPRIPRKPNGSTLRNIFGVFGRKYKSRAAHLKHASLFARTSETVAVCHTRPQDPGRAWPGPSRFPTFYLHVPTIFADQNGPKTSLSPRTVHR